MSFYNPLAVPTFEATRLQIQRTIMGLEQRLLRRKQLDLQIEKDIIHQEQLQKLTGQQKEYDPFGKVYLAEIELQKRLRNLRTFDPRENYSNPIAHHISRQALQLDYLARLREIQRHQLLLNERILNKDQNLQQKFYNDGNHLFDESGQMLARKYFDGTRAYEYNEELKRSGDKERNINAVQDYVKNNNKQLFAQSESKDFQRSEPNYSTVKKYQSSSQKHDTDQNQFQYQNYQNSSHQSRQSPIKQIQNSSRFNSTLAKIVKLNKEKQAVQNYHQNQQKVEDKLKKSYHNAYLHQMQPKHRLRTKSTQPTNQLINVPQNIHFRESASRSPSRSHHKSSTKSSRQIPNNNYSSKSLHQLLSTKFHLPLLRQKLPIEQKFKIWFRDRTRLAEEAKQILEIKYAKNFPEYLMTVWEKEEKFRQELKEKICKIPQVERKFDVGPVKE